MLQTNRTDFLVTRDNNAAAGVSTDAGRVPSRGDSLYTTTPLDHIADMFGDAWHCYTLPHHCSTHVYRQGQNHRKLESPWGRCGSVGDRGNSDRNNKVREHR